MKKFLSFAGTLAVTAFMLGNQAAFAQGGGTATGAGGSTTTTTATDKRQDDNDNNWLGLLGLLGLAGLIKKPKREVVHEQSLHQQSLPPR